MMNLKKMIVLFFCFVLLFSMLTSCDFDDIFTSESDEGGNDSGAENEMIENDLGTEDEGANVIQLVYAQAQSNGFEGTLDEFLSLVKGADGKNGTDGKDGINGKDGATIFSIAFNQEGQLVITMTDNREFVLDMPEKEETPENGDSNTPILPNDSQWTDRENYYVCVGIDGVALRKGPGVDYDMVAVLNANTKLKCTRTSDNWNEVIYDGMTYYVSAQYSGSAKDFEFYEFETQAQVSLSIKEERRINLRTTPFYSDSAKEFNVGIIGFDESALDGKDANNNDVVESLKLIGRSKSGEWFKVSYTGSWRSTPNGSIQYYENKIFYLKATVDVVSCVEGLPSTGASSNGGTVLG